MTLDEAKKIFINRGYIEVDGGKIFNGDAWRDAVFTISKWLEQELCEDAISRETVLKMQYRIDDSATLATRDVVNVEDIEELPSVQPKVKTGHWIPVDDKNDAFDCSECIAMVGRKTNYCPGCGAKMVEPQESEEEE